MVLQRMEPLQSLGNPFQRLYPLTEDNRLLTAGCYFLQIRLESVQFGAGTGQRVEIANLLQPQHKLKHMLNG